MNEKGLQIRSTLVSPFLNKPTPRQLSVTFVRKFCIPIYSKHLIKKFAYWQGPGFFRDMK